ncbi:MAG: hypothetical protein U0414_24655 [Polyangiaceae bacterium]
MTPASLFLPGAALALSVGLATAARAADGADTKEKAHEAYERGTKASEAGRYHEAAVAYAEADELAPNKVALESALEVCVLADDPVLGAELLTRAKRDPTISADTLEKAHTKFDGRAGRLVLRCEGACAAKLDGAPVTRRDLWVELGAHHVSIAEGPFTLDQDVDVKPGVTLELEVDRARAKPEPEGDRAVPADGVSTRVITPAFAYVGMGLTAGLLAGTIGSGVDARAKHDAFLGAASPEKPAAAEEGREAQIRTNVLVAVTSVTGALTLGLGLLAVPWGGSSKQRTSAELFVGPSCAGVRGRF